jgi:hypothetical protein
MLRWMMGVYVMRALMPTIHRRILPQIAGFFGRWWLRPEEMVCHFQRQPLIAPPREGLAYTVELAVYGRRRGGKEWGRGLALEVLLHRDPGQAGQSIVGWAGVRADRDL